MKTPESLENLVDDGIIQEVLRPLMSGKEAQVYVVRAGGEECVAKVYKESDQRTFKHRAEYTEGRRTRNSRDQRAVSKRTRHGRKQDEAAWRNTEVEMIYRLRGAGVRVPKPIDFVDGVLVMELIRDAHGDPAPRLGDLSFEASEADAIHRKLIREVVRMLCAGVVHGDLSDFNVLLGVDGPVLIDFPQAVDPAHNQNARKLLLRDVDNLHRFLDRFAPARARRGYALEMWSLYESNRLEPESELHGNYRDSDRKADTDEVLALIDDAKSEERARRRARGEEAPASAATAPKPLRQVVDFTNEITSQSRPVKRTNAGRVARPQRAGGRATEKAVAATASGSTAGAAPKKRRNRRRRKSRSGPAGEAAVETGASGDAKRPAGHAAGARGADQSSRADRPARRRRRRPRPARSRETT